MRWPGKIKAARSERIVSHIDMLPTLLAAPAIRTSRKSCSTDTRRRHDYKVHLDGYNMIPT